MPFHTNTVIKQSFQRHVVVLGNEMEYRVLETIIVIIAHKGTLRICASTSY